MSLLSIFRRPKTIDDVFDRENGHLAKVGGWVDGLNFSQQERAEMNAGIAAGVRQFAVDTLSENTDRSKARRNIAEFWMQFYGLMIFMCGMTYPIDPEWSRVWLTLCTSVSVAGLVASISIFFFGSHALAKYEKDKK